MISLASVLPCGRRLLLRRWSCVLALALAFGAPRLAWALDANTPAITQYVLEHWSHRDGLPANTINAIAQSQDGYLWIGTTAGLARFDGVRFVSIPTDPTNPEHPEFITSLAVGRDNVIWAGTRNGGLRRVVHNVGGSLESNGQEGIVFKTLLDAQNRLFLVTSTGVLRLEGQGVKLFSKQANYATAAAFDSAGNLWVADQDSLYLLDQDGMRREKVDTKVFGEAVLVDRAGAVWVGSYGGLLRWHDHQLKGFNEFDPALGRQVKTLAQDADGNLWVGTVDGLVRVQMTENGPRIATLRIPGGVLSLAEDREGSLWVGAVDGLHRLKNAKVTMWGELEGIPAFIPSINVGPSGSVFVFSGAADNRVTEIRDNRVSVKPGIVIGSSLLARDGSFWSATNGTLVQLKGNEAQRFGAEAGVPPRWISTMMDDGEDLIITPDLGGIRRWKPGNSRPYLLRDNTAFTSEYYVMTSMRDSHGVIWMGTYDGLWRLADGEVTRYTTPRGEESNRPWYDAHPQSKTCFHTVVSSDMADYWIMSIAEASGGTLWLGSNRGGLTRLRDGKFTKITQRQGLPTDEIFSVLVDYKQDVWLGTAIGIFRLKAEELEELANGARAKVTPIGYSTFDGLRSDECLNVVAPMACKAADGVLWFATRSGAAAIDPRLNRSNKLPPPVLVEQVVVDNRPVEKRAPVVIPARYNKLEIHFTALSLATPERVRFKYQLEGYDPSFVEARGERIAHYSQLPPGDYRFVVKACNDDGVWNEQGAAIELSVPPRFYQTVWFLGACAALATSAVVGTHRWKVRQLRAREAELQSHVDQRTKELSQANADLKKEMAERQRAEADVARINRELIIASHKAGMAQIAADVLHNVGNALNSLAVSANVIRENVERGNGQSLTRVADLIAKHEADLPAFFGPGGAGKKLPHYLAELAKHSDDERAALKNELGELTRHLGYITDLVAKQQEHARITGPIDQLEAPALITDAVHTVAEDLARDGVALSQDVAKSLPTVSGERHKLLQILVSMLRHAHRATVQSSTREKRIELRAALEANHLVVVARDNGVGLTSEQLAEVFSQSADPCGLHSAAIFAHHLGGTLRAESAGLDAGSTLTLSIPIPANGKG